MLRMRIFSRVAIAMLLALAFGSPIYSSQSDQGPQEASAVEAELVLIPGGEFLMGKDGEGDHSPAHKVYIDSFYIDKCEVTNAQYAKFCEETGRQLPEFWGMKEFHSGVDFPNHPVVGISWIDAQAYAEWAGKRLPTEAEWEYAARGGLARQDYPNGDKLDPTQANYIDAELGGTVPVGSFPPNDYGLYDMAGNVSEWIADYYAEDYYARSPYRNSKGPRKGRFKVIRGGGWHSGLYSCKVYWRNALLVHWVDLAVGFRCAKDIR